jgi:hypothetical protein
VFAWALAVSQPLHFLSFAILGVQPLDVFAWSLTAVGMGAAAWALVSSSLPAPGRARGVGFAAAGT